MYSLETRIKALAVAGMMAASVAGGAVTAFAEVKAPNLLTSDGITVKKNVEVAKGISFNRTFTFVAQNTGAPEGATAPQLTSKTTEALTQNATSKEVTMALKSEFAGAIPGVYTYEIAESKNNMPTKDSDGYGWTYSDGKYILRVYVSNNTGDDKGTDLKIVKYTLVDASKVEGKTEKTQDYDDQKTTVASFSNIYTKRGNSGPDGDKDKSTNPSLVVDKKVVGEYGDLDQYFKFTVTFDTPDTDKNASHTLKMEFKNNTNGHGAENDGYTADASLTLTDGSSYVFYLKNGGSVSFDNIPAGTTYTLAEAKQNKYTASAAVVENGQTPKEIKPEDGVINMSDLLIGENANTVCVTNTYDDGSITITGVVTHSAPFVIMVGALFVAVGGYVVLKKRIEE